MEKINGPIQLSAIPKGALVIFDDVLELDRSDPRRQIVYDLLNWGDTRRVRNQTRVVVLRQLS